jgi:DNA-binding NtrC family response regulator
MDKKNRVLIVDDEPNVRLVLGTALSSVGYEVVEAEDGTKALEQLRSDGGRFDLVLLDLQMPRIDGMALLSRLRDAGSIVPVVILTAHGSIPEAVTAMKLGAIDFLTKPITPEALRRVVAEVIARQAAAPQEPRLLEPGPVPADRSKQVAFDLARAKRAINRCQFGEAEIVLHEILALAPESTEAALLLKRLEKLKEEESRGSSYRILRDWFPGGGTGRR